MAHTENLFKRDLLGNILVWHCTVERHFDNNNISYIRLAYCYGELGGLNTISYSDRIIAKSKKTDYDQAVFEMNSIFNRKRKQGYKTLKDLNIDISNNYIAGENHFKILYDKLNGVLPRFNTDINNCIKPMKCQKFEIGKFKYPALIQSKINGVRVCIMLEEFIPEDLFTLDGFTKDNKYYRSVIKSKEGLLYDIFHITQLFDHLYQAFPEYSNIIFDGEIYIKDEKVTSIGGAARNPKNELHTKLQFVNFDLSVPDLTNIERDSLRNKIWNDYISKFKKQGSYNICAGHIWINTCLEAHDMWKGFDIIVLDSVECFDDNQALNFMNKAIEQGFEGAVLRTKDEEYKFGSRPKTMMKLKKFEDAEFECIGISHVGNPDDGIGFTVILHLKNDINNYKFDCTLMGTINERLNILSNSPIGKMVTVKFYERTKNGLPFHANVIGIRDYE